MIDITQYRLLTPAIAILNVPDELTIYFRTGEIKTVVDDNLTHIDLRDVAGIQNDDFNLVFFNRDDEFINACKESEDWLQAIYNVFDFTESHQDRKWVEVQELTPLEFLDRIYDQENFSDKN